MRKPGPFLLLISFLLLAACGSSGDETQAVITVVATPTSTPVVVTVIATPTPTAAGIQGQPTPLTADTLPSSTPSPLPPPEQATPEQGLPAPGGDETAFWDSFPLPPDAEVVPVVEGIDLAFTTGLAEPQVFDYYATWLELRGWSRQAPTEAMLTPPHQRWQKDVVELLIEIPGLDEAGRTTVWVQLTYLTTDALPQPVERSDDVLPEPATPATLRDELIPLAGDGWSSSAYGNPAGTRYNATSLTPPLQLAWEWGHGESRRPIALVTAGERLYVLTNQGDLHILDGQGQEMAYTSVWDEGGSGPGDLVTTSDSVVACSSAWLAGRHPTYPARVVGLDLEGQRRWEIELPDDQGPCYLLADQGLVAVAPAGSGPEANWLSVRDAASGEERWRATMDSGSHFRPLASDGSTLFVAQPYLIAYDLASGQVRWQQSDDQFRDAIAAVYEGRLYAVAGSGTLFVLDPTSGQVLQQFPAQNAFGTTLANGHGFLAQDGGLYAVDVATGARPWYWPVPEGEEVTYLLNSQSHVLAVTWRPGAGAGASTLHLLDPATGEERGSLSLTWWEPKPLSGGLAVADGLVYALSDRLRAYAPGQLEVEAPAPPPQPSSTTPPTAPPPKPSPTTPAPKPTAWIPPQPSPQPGASVTGRYAEVWARLGGAAGRLGQPLSPAVEDTFAEQHFERGLMHWGRWDTVGDPEREVQVIVYGNGGSNARAGDLWGRFIDYWQEGDAEYSCAEATPPLGPRRGFGLVWCRYARDSLGAPLEEERGVQASYQDFQYGTMIWSPTDGGIYVLFNQGDWQFEAIE